MTKLLPEYSVRIYYEDVDAGGICYHSKYLNFCERARSEIFFTQNKSPIIGNYHFVVKKINADFLHPAVFGNTLTVNSSILDFKNASITMLQKVYYNQKLLFKMEVLLVCLEGGKVSKIPAEFKTIFLQDNINNSHD